LNSPDLLDLKPLAQLPRLGLLEMREVRAGDYSALLQLTELQVVIVEGGPLTDISPLVTSPNLKHLIVSDVAVSDLSPLVMAPSQFLGSISVTRAQVSDLSPLLNVSFPTGTLYIQENPLSDLAVDEQIPQLVERGWCVVTGSLPEGEEHPPNCIEPDKP
jgi:hypothetical protein